ncbi:MAG: phage tail protein [Caldilineaceae bacterium]
MAMQSQDPIKSYLFKLEIEGDQLMGLFTECSGIGSETEVIEHKVVQNGKPVIMKVPGRLKWENITLKKGITDDMKVWNWRHQIEIGQVEGNRFNGSIIMTDHDLTPVARWDFERGWPTKVSGPSPKADSNEIGIEEIVLAHEGILRVS